MKTSLLASIKDRAYYDAESAKIVHKWNCKWLSFINNEFDEGENKFEYLLNFGEAATDFLRNAKLSDASVMKFERMEFKREVNVRAYIFRFYYQNEVFSVRVHGEDKNDAANNKINKIATYPAHIFINPEEVQILLNLLVKFQLHKFAEELADISLEIPKSGGGAKHEQNKE